MKTVLIDYLNAHHLPFKDYNDHLIVIYEDKYIHSLSLEYKENGLTMNVPIEKDVQDVRLIMKKNLFTTLGHFNYSYEHKKLFYQVSYDLSERVLSTEMIDDFFLSLKDIQLLDA